MEERELDKLNGMPNHRTLNLFEVSCQTQRKGAAGVKDSNTKKCVKTKEHAGWSADHCKIDVNTSWGCVFHAVLIAYNGNDGRPPPAPPAPGWKKYQDNGEPCLHHDHTVGSPRLFKNPCS